MPVHDAPHVSLKKRLGRRTFLRGAGVALALPWLDAMTPAHARSRERRSPRRMMAICNNLGFVPDKFFPADGGLDGAGDDASSPYLEELADVRDRVTVLEGVSHPGVNGSHASDVSFLTGAPGPGTGGFQNSVSLDQYVAGQLGPVTRFPSLTLGVNASPGRRSLSWTESGVLIPCEDSAAEVYRRLFLRGTDAEVRARMHELRLGRSIMDAVGAQSKSLQRTLGPRDRERLDQFETAVRDVERRLTENEGWAQRPKPEAPIPQPTDPAERTAFMEKSALMYQMAKLAFETDSTRTVTLLLDTNATPTVSDVRDADVEITDGYHNLSHHGKNAKKLAQLEAIDRNHLRLFGSFLGDLAAVGEDDADLLTNTSILLGSNLGDANKHTTTNLPLMLAGGRFRHEPILRFDRQNNEPLANLFVSVLQQMGFETDRFATGTRTLPGLETV
ncbi:DUF1552 domain-containing protein [Alienimonas californiensis]|uniref:DUF1552 domain-containing protein n=1 Tax=Alienimonas californiensis TaxID=2527989 RepID=A0A517P6L9_9PLAN|nr:DUF1552 domain-containing protein [Alienimonas californiensis]QDT15014.1 hypothetical protein CA12_10940 [Alienimonas californiensis]